MVGRMKTLIFLLGSLATMAQAETLPDPTRPPAAVLAAQQSAVADVTESEEAATGLQAVLLRRSGKPLAIINGQTVHLGGKLGDARLVRLTETTAVLDGPNGRETLRLIQDVSRKDRPVARLAAVKHGKNHKKSVQTAQRQIPNSLKK